MKKRHRVLYATVLFALITMCPSFAIARGGAGDVIGGILISLLITLIVFLILREVMCWYWKINTTLVKLDKSIILLESIDRSLKSFKSSNLPQDKFQSQTSRPTSSELKK